MISERSSVITGKRQKGACNQGEKFQDFYRVSSGTLRALCYWRECSPVEQMVVLSYKNAPRRAHLAIVPICAISSQFHQVNKKHHPLKFHDYRIYELKQHQQFRMQKSH